MKNKIKSLLIVITLVIVSALFGTITVSAAESVTIANVWKVDGVNFRTTTSGKPAYCMHKTKSSATKGTTLTLVKTHVKGPYVYILNDTKIAGTGLTDKSRTIRQKALWAYNGYDISGSYTSQANSLVSAARSAGANYEINPTVVSITTPVMTKNGSYYTSNRVTVKMKDVTNNNYSVSFTGAPSGTTVINKSGLSFQVRVPVSSVTKNTTFKVTVKGQTSSWKYVKQYHKNDRTQDVSVPVAVNKAPSKSVNTTVTYKTCHVVGSTYYGSKGTVVTQTDYYKQCNPKCIIQDSKYYDNNGKPVTEEEYNNACNPKCEIKDNVYYDNTGKKVTEEEYNNACNPKCEIKDNVYYDNTGKKVTEEEYNNVCNPKCEVKNNVYYGAKGNIVTEDIFNNECNPKCTIKDNKYYGKNGSIVTIEEYNKECNPSCKVVQGKYYGKNNDVVTKDEYTVQCTTQKVMVPNSGSNKNKIGMAVGLTMVIGSLGLLFKDKFRRNM